MPTRSRGWLHWAILVEKNQRDAYLAIDKMTESLALWGLIGLAVAGAGAVALALGMSRPILEIDRVAVEVAKGNFAIRVVRGVRLKDEIGDLARRMNEMIVGLNERFQLEKFVSGGTMAAIRTSEHEGVQLGGARRRATMLFCDIRGYTAFAERHEPDVVVDVLNFYFQHLTDLVTQHHGDVDKFVGDQIVAVFQGDDMESDAVACALAMQQKMAELSRERPEWRSRRRDRHQHGRGDHGRHGQRAADGFHGPGRRGEPRRPALRARRSRPDADQPEHLRGDRRPFASWSSRLSSRFRSRARRTRSSSMRSAPCRRSKRWRADRFGPPCHCPHSADFLGITRAQAWRARRPLTMVELASWRRVMSAPGSDRAIVSIAKWARRDEWCERLDWIIDAHFGPILAAINLPVEDLPEILSEGFSALFGCVLEDFLTCGFGPDQHSIVDDYLKRRGFREPAPVRSYLRALRRSVMSAYQVEATAPGSHIVLRDLIRNGDPIRVEDKLGAQSSRRRIISPRGAADQR